jgi:hypothetical protein
VKEAEPNLEALAVKLKFGADFELEVALLPPDEDDNMCEIEDSDR